MGAGAGILVPESVSLCSAAILVRAIPTRAPRWHAPPEMRLRAHALVLAAIRPHALQEVLHMYAVRAICPLAITQAATYWRQSRFLDGLCIHSDGGREPTHFIEHCVDVRHCREAKTGQPRSPKLVYAYFTFLVAQFH